MVFDLVVVESDNASCASNDGVEVIVSVSKKTCITFNGYACTWKKLNQNGSQYYWCKFN